MFFGIRTPMLPKYSQAWIEARKDPIIGHFTNARKPWAESVWHPYKKTWIDCLNQTPYTGKVSITNYRTIIDSLFIFLTSLCDSIRFVIYKIKTKRCLL